MTECSAGGCDHLPRRVVIAGALAGVLATVVPREAVRAAAPPMPLSVARGLSIMPRDAWGSTLPPKPGLASEPDVRFLLLHHTAGATTYSASGVPSQIQQIYRFHTSREKRWADVCYNFFVDRFGGVWEGRAGSISGAVMADATGGSQGFAQLVCLLGNFDTSSPSAAMMESCANVLAWLTRRYAIEPDQSKMVTFISRGSNRWKAGTSVVARPISGHRDMSATVCPGRYVYPLLETTLPKRIRHFRGVQTRSP